MHSPQRHVSTYEQQLVQALPHVDAVIRQVARRYRLAPDECDELSGHVRLRLVEDDYAVFRRFEGRSTLRTYLTTVVTRLFLDERTRAWGKWRPSTEARRLGPLAMTLERLITRDHLTVDEAVTTLMTRDPTCTEVMLRQLADRLPRRSLSPRLVDDTELADLPARGPSSDHLVVEDEVRVSRQAAHVALNEALAALPSRDRLLLTLRYVQGCRVADIAAVVREPQKPLYRRCERLLDGLRNTLTARGITADRLTSLFDTPIDDVAGDAQDAAARNRDDMSVSRDEAQDRLDPVTG